MFKITYSNDLLSFKRPEFGLTLRASQLILTLLFFTFGSLFSEAKDRLPKDEKNQILVIIDSDLPDAHILIDAAKQQYKNPHIQVLNKKASSKKQLVDLLNSYPEASLGEFVLFSHGSSGAIHLGGEKIDKYSINLKSSQLFDALEYVLSRDANVLLYGCEIAKDQAGLEFIRRMEERIQAKISASTNLTGSLVSGGDWILEISDNKFNNLDLYNYNFFLQTTTIDFNSEAFVEGADYGSNTYISGDYRLVYSSGNFFEDTDSGSSGSKGLLIAQYVNNETLTIETVSGNEFDLVSFFLTNYFNYTATIEAFKDGTSVTSIPLSPSTNGSVIPFNSDFDNIDQAIITFSPGAFDIIDDITFGPPISSLTLPTITTISATNITSSTVDIGGNVTDDGGASVTARGFVYSSTDNTPEIGESNVTQVPDGSGTGVFNESITGLSPSTTYYFSAYATNSEGTSYGSVLNFNTLAPPNSAPTDISLSNNTIGESATGADATVGTLSTTDADAGDTHTYTLVSGTGDSDNGNFNISGNELRTNSALSAGNYSVRINSNDGTDDFAKEFTVTVIDDVAPSFENSTPNSTLVTSTDFTLAADINEAGVIYYVVLDNDAPAPTAAEVKAASVTNVQAGSQVLSSEPYIANDFIIDGLISGTDYDVYVVAEDDETVPNLQSTPTLFEVTTLPNNPPFFVDPESFYDLSNANLSDDLLDLSALATSPIDISFSDDGTKLLIADSAPGESPTPIVLQYHLSVPFQLATAVFETSFNLNRLGDIITSIDFIENGNQMIILVTDSDFNNFSYIAYDLDTPYDLTGNVILDVDTEVDPAFDGAFNEDGTKLFALDPSTQSLVEVPLSIPYDLNSAGITENFIDLGAAGQGAFKFQFAANGQILYILYASAVGSPNDVIITYALPSPYDLSSAISVGSEFNFVPGSEVEAVADFEFTDSKLFVLDLFGQKIVSYDTRANIDYAENAATVVIDANASDGDGGNLDEGITYTLSGPDAGLFTIDAATGAIDFISAPDFENPLDEDANNSYILTVTADDGQPSNNLTSVEIVVNVTNINEAPSLTVNTGTDVGNGCTVTLSNTMLAATDADDAAEDLIYTVTTLPANGELIANGNTTLGLNDTFTQVDIDNNLIAYTHNGSATNNDSFEFSLADGGEDGVSPITNQSFTIAVNAPEDASFSYDAATYCTSAADPTPTVTGVTGGSFISTAGLSINAASGAIDVSASTPGTYTVTYTTAGDCPNSADVSVTINALDDASFSYDSSTYETTAIDPLPVITGNPGGSFSSTAGLSIDGNSGLIDLSASTPGDYTVTYTTTGPCVNSSTFELTIENTLSTNPAQITLRSLSLYPNPATTALHINNPSQLALQHLWIYDLQGRLVKDLSMDSHNFNPHINVSNLEAAVYILKLQTQDNRQTTLRFTKR